MILAGLVFALPIMSGALLVHLVWPERGLALMLVKLALGVGVGLGLRSLLYFVYLLLFAGQNWFVGVELLAFLLLLGLSISRGRGATRFPSTVGSGGPRFGPVTLLLGAVAGLVVVVSLLSTANYLLRRKQGDWDAWMMYNRSARFIYLDQANWRQSFSPRMDPLFHADYPLLLATNVAAGWQELGRETAAVPMLQSALFSLGCAGLLASAVGAATTFGQGALAVIILWGLPVTVNEGARQMADVPLAYYILATGTLVFLGSTRQQRQLILLAGLTAGLGAWTKNEGALLVVGAAVGVLIATRGHGVWKSLGSYGAGLAAPLAVLLYFRLLIAPPGDMLGGGATRLATQSLDVSRHLEILRYFGQVLIGFGGWGIAPLVVGIIPILVVYFLLVGSGRGIARWQVYAALAAILVIQLAGDYGAFLLTPYDLGWHLSYSTNRLFLQVFPLFLFVVLTAAKPAESVLSFLSGQPRGAQDAASH
ncbi:MAG: glycosyltransferase family 39 protein [Anaerolineales bacterium]